MTTSHVVARAARDNRVAASRRAELGKLLEGKGLRNAADTDPDLQSRLAKARAALSEDDKAAAEWHKALTEAATQWEAALAEFHKLHTA